MALVAPQFLSATNLSQVTALAAIIAIAAVGEAMVIITKSIDLSVESTIGLTAFWSATSCAAATAGPRGLGRRDRRRASCSGWSTAPSSRCSRCPRSWSPWARSASIAGFVFILAGGNQVNLADLPEGYTDPATHTILGIPVFVLVAIVIVVVVALILRSTRFGRQLYAVGSNAEAAAILGIRPRGSCSWRSPWPGSWPASPA